MTLEQLKSMLADGTFHHATYREYGSIWEGLYIYSKATKEQGGFQGYKLAGCFPKGAEADAAHELVRNTGVSVGAYGKG